jgi:hypothetical protein
MIVLNILFTIWAAKWVIESESFFGWFVGGICFVLNLLAVLTYFY